MARKVDFPTALEWINDQNRIDFADIQARALRRFVWVAEWHVPGCLSESFAVHTTKRDALAHALDMCGHARGAATELRRFGRTDRTAPDAYVSCAITTIQRMRLRELA